MTDQHRVPTVGGPVAASDLGVTLMHEHVFVLSPEIIANYPEGWGDDAAREDAAVDIDAVDSVDHVRANVDVATTLARAEDVARVADAFVRLDARDQETLRAFLDGEAAGAPRERKRRQRAIDRLKALVLGPATPPLPGDDHV